MQMTMRWYGSKYDTVTSCFISGETGRSTWRPGQEPGWEQGWRSGKKAYAGWKIHVLSREGGQHPRRDPQNNPP